MSADETKSEELERRNAVWYDKQFDERIKGVKPIFIPSRLHEADAAAWIYDDDAVWPHLSFLP